MLFRFALVLVLLSPLHSVSAQTLPPAQPITPAEDAAEDQLQRETKARFNINPDLGPWTLEAARAYIRDPRSALHKSLVADLADFSTPAERSAGAANVRKEMAEAKASGIPEPIAQAIIEFFDEELAKLSSAATLDTGTATIPPDAQGQDQPPAGESEATAGGVAKGIPTLTPATGNDYLPSDGSAVEPEGATANQSTASQGWKLPHVFAVVDAFFGISKDPWGAVVGVLVGLLLINAPRLSRLLLASDTDDALSRADDALDHKRRRQLLFWLSVNLGLHWMVPVLLKGTTISLGIAATGTVLALQAFLPRWLNRRIRKEHDTFEDIATVGRGSKLITQQWVTYTVDIDGQIKETLARWLALGVVAAVCAFAATKIWGDFQGRAALSGAGLALLLMCKGKFYKIPEIHGNEGATRFGTDHGTARPATVDEFLATGDVTRDLSGAIWMGADPEHAPHPALGYSGELSAVTIGPPGSGKFACAIAPTLLTYSAGSVLVYDPKGQAAAVTGAYRKRIGHQVIYFNPFHDATVPGPSASCNPVAELNPDSPEFESDVRVLAGILQPVDPHENNKFFPLGARGMIGAVLMHLRMKQGETASLPMLSDALHQADPQLDAMFKAMTESDIPAVRNCGAKFFDNLGRTSAADIISTARGSVEFLSDRVMVALFSNGPDRFSWKQLKAGKTTVYIIFPPRQGEAYNKASELLITSALNVALEKPKAPVLFIVDEFATALPRRGVAAEKFLQAFAYGRDNGVRVWAIFQTWSQMLGMFEKESDLYTILAPAGMLQFFGAGDMLTAEKISEHSGKETILQSVLPGKNWNSMPGDTPQQSTMGRPLIEAKTLRGMVGDGGQVIWIAKVENPLLSMKRFPRYFEIPWLRERAARDPFH